MRRVSTITDPEVLAKRVDHIDDTLKKVQVRVEKKKAKNHSGLTLSQLKLKARQEKVRGWYAMKANELVEVLASRTVAARREQISNDAVARWKQYSAK